MSLTRRRFLGAAVAAPVAAKEAAQKMGLESLASMPPGAGANAGIDSAFINAPPGLANDVDWAKRGLATLDSPREVAHRALMAKHQARILDADLAAMRSISPSAAYTLQRQRVEHWLRESRRSDFIEAIAESGKSLGKSLLAV